MRKITGNSKADYCFKQDIELLIAKTILFELFSKLSLVGLTEVNHFGIISINSHDLKVVATNAFSKLAFKNLIN